MRRGPTAAEVDRALAGFARTAALTPHERAERRFLAAKRAFHEATEAVMRRERGAAERADQALAELNGARAELEAVAGAEVKTS